MRTATKREKWMIGVLAVFCLGLVVNLVRQTGGVKAGSPRATARVPAALSPQASANLSSKTPATAEGTRDSSLELDLLEKLQSQPLAPLDRNPFEFGLTPDQKAAQLEEQKVKSRPPAPPAPPPPPPVTVKAMGFAEDKSGKRRALLTDDEQSYKVLEGESFAGRYRCLKITPSAIEIQDESYHQTVQLPFPQ